MVGPSQFRRRKTARPPLLTSQFSAKKKFFLKNHHRCFPLAGVVADRGRGLPQTGDRVLRRAPDAFGPDEATAGALFYTAVRRHVADGHRCRRAGQ